MRLTIERMRTLVLAAGVLLIAMLAVFLAIGKWRNPFNRQDIPKRLGIDIEQESNGVTYTQAHGGHTLFKIHASRAVQLKQGNALLHDVKIELYGADGKSVDRIEGNEFEYDAKDELAKAAGAVEITLMRPGVAPVVAPKATTTQPAGAKAKPLAAAAATAASGEIHVKTSGLTFNWKSGVATTEQRVDFSMVQGTGSSVGASYDSQKGWLVLDRAVQLNTHRGAQAVELHAQHAELERGDQVCRLTGAEASYSGGEARGTEAIIQFRDDGSASKLDATQGFTLTTTTGGRLTAPIGRLEFDEHNQPRHGHLEGGVTIDSNRDGRTINGTAPTMEIDFTAAGVLRSAHLERGVKFVSDEQSNSAAGVSRTHRSWTSLVADLQFHDFGHGRVELASIHGTGGVLVTDEDQHGSSPVTPFRMTADDVTGAFGAVSSLTQLIGVGNAGIVQTTAAGTRQSTNGDRLVAHFKTGPVSGTKAAVKGEVGHGAAGSTQIQSATVEGHVLLTEQPAAKPGAPEPSILRASADQAVYEGAGERLHLTGSPRVEDGGLELTADKIDVSQDSGDAFAHGNVKATWFGNETDKTAGQRRNTNDQGNATLGGEGPAHAIAAEAQLHQATGEATFRGQARLWQQANSIAAPVIVLNRTRQTLVARATSAAEPVRVVLLSAAGTAPGKKANSGALAVIRVRGGDLRYSAAEHKAIMQGGTVGEVEAEMGEATTTSKEVELTLLPPGNHAGKDGASAQVDRLTARGHVVVSSQGRRGTGEQLVYTGETGDYVLTGTAAAPPRLTDPGRGTTTGEALIFNSRDDSVSIEGGGRKTTTETTAPR
ncbi:MAG: LptA/OstA family protein [Terracidiphilus sp.]